MGRINVLDKSVYNRLAAGQVVENPASIVKELVENSIDAGAQNITVMIESGGIKSITVTDDGCGIEKDDLPLAVMLHATSKISSAEDLGTIATLGFRGEALASIATVSRTEIKSKFLDSDIANYIVVKGGEIEEEGECSLSVGTSINISSLFFNTPGRYNFLKTAKGEEANVTHSVYDLMLSNTDISIKYYIDGRLVNKTNGEGLESVIPEIYGQEIFDNLIKFEANEKNYSIKGFTARPATDAIQGNKNKQVFIVNGRVFQDTNLPAIIQNAYGERLMKRTFPVVILDIVMPFDEVDVNVHPGKKEVRFAEKKLLNGMIYSAIKSALEKDEELIEEKMRLGSLLKNDTRRELGAALQRVMKTADEEENRIIVADASKHQLNDMMKKFSLTESDLEPLGLKPVDFQLRKLPPDYEQFEKKINPEDIHPEEREYILPRNVSKEKLLEKMPPGFVGQIARNPYNPEDVPEERFKVAYVDEEEAEQERETIYGDSLYQTRIETDDEENALRYRIVGQIFDTYFILEMGKRLFFIDQHAAHERILYDKLIKETNEHVRVRGMLVPYYRKMSPEEMNLFKDQEENLISLGFEFIFHPTTMEITSAPMVLSDIDLDEFVFSVLDNQGEIKYLRDIKKIKDKFARIACRSAIKGGMRLSEDEISYVMDYFLKNGMPLQCPHGRPTMVVFNKNEVEKWFKRIV